MVDVVMVLVHVIVGAVRVERKFTVASVLKVTLDMPGTPADRSVIAP